MRPNPPVSRLHRLARALAPVLAAVLVATVLTVVIVSSAQAHRATSRPPLALAPPPPVIPPPPTPQPEDPEPATPNPTTNPRPEAAAEPPPALSLNPVPVHLDLGIDPSRLRLDATSGLGAALTTREQIARFTFEDLDSPPRAVYVPRPRIPRRLADAGFEGGVVTFLIHINRSGQVSVLEVLDTTESALVNPAREVAERARFSPPTINGQPVEVTGRWPLSIQTR